MIVRLRIVGCLIGLAGCATSGAAVGATSGGGTVSKWSGSFRPTTSASNAVLAPATPNRGLGMITVTPLGGTPATSRINLSINTGAGGGGNQVAWAVFSGPCGSPGPIVAGQNQYPPISISSSGDGRVEVMMAFTLDPKSSYHANIYSTPRANDMNDVMMCANLQPGG